MRNTISECCAERIVGIMTPQWPLLAPVLWLALMYVIHSSKDPVQAVIGWALIFAPLYLAVVVAELFARIGEWRRYRAFERKR
jgi:hypothetical protein